MAQKNLKEIDPAYESFSEFSKVTKGTTALIQKMRQQAIYADGVVPAKYKSLAAALWSIAVRCEPCIKYYVQLSAKNGATKEEIGEFLAVGSTMGGCVGETWSLKAFKAYQDLDDSQSKGQEACCTE